MSRSKARKGGTPWHRGGPSDSASGGRQEVLLAENPSARPGPSQPTKIVGPTRCIFEMLGGRREKLENGGDDRVTHRGFIDSGTRVKRR